MLGEDVLKYEDAHGRVEKSNKGGSDTDGILPEKQMLHGLLNLFVNNATVDGESKHTGIMQRHSAFPVRTIKAISHDAEVVRYGGSV